jgi:hypothetical protein
MNEHPEAAFYRPSGRVNLLRVALLFPVAAAYSLLIGYLLCKAFHNGLYVTVLAPLVAGMLTAAAAFAVVFLGHCRNRVLGALAGLVLGAGMYLSYFQFDFAHLAGFRNLHRVDALPMWVRLRVLTDERQQVGANANNANGPIGPRDDTDRAFRWLFFAFESALAVLPAVALGWVTAAAPYSERHRRWMTTHKMRCAAGAGEDVADALLAGDAPEQVARYYQPAAGGADELDELQIDYLPNEPDSPVFLSLALVTNATNAKKVRRKSVIQRRVLTAEQAAALATAISIPHARFGPDDGRRQAGEAASDVPAGRVFELPDAEAWQILSRGTIYRAAFVQLSPLLLGLGAAAALGVAAYMHWGDWNDVVRGVVVAAGIAAPVAAVVYLLRYEEILPALYFLRKARVVIQARAEPVVEADDPDAAFVEHVPRANWHRLMMKNATDIGLFKVDARRRVLLFEGDRERWVIPAEGVLSCEVEEFTELGQEENKCNLHAVVVLTANVDGRVWEAPIQPRPTAFACWRAPERRRKAAELCATVRAVLPGAEMPPRSTPSRG